MTGARDMENIVWGPDHPQFDWTVEDFFEGRANDFFEGRVNVYADLSFWCKAAHWTVDEATALSFGFDPYLAEWGSLAAEEHPFTIDYKSRRNLALRAIAMDLLPNNDLIPPIAYVRWATNVGIPIKPELKKWVRARGKEVALGAADDIPNPKVLKSLFRLALGLTKDAYYGQGPYNPDDSLYGEIVKDLAAAGFITQTDTVKRVLDAVKNEDEVDKFTPADYMPLMKMVLGLAIKHYDYDPEAKRNKATKDIASILDRQRKFLDKETIRRRLREAAVALRE
jgi:hypothetical protein